MNTTAKLTSSSIKMFVRNRQAVFFTLFVPIVIMTIFGLLGFDNVPKIDVGVVQEPANQHVFSDQLKQISALDVHFGTEDDERARLADGDRAAVLLIPAAVDQRQLTPLSPATITVLKNVGKPQEAGTVVSLVRQMLDQATLAAAQAPTLFQLDVQEVNARNLKYIDFLLPGIVALAIMQMAVFSVAFVFVDYKEKGILKRLLATPMKPFQFVSANVITRLLVAVVQAAILIVVGVLVFKAHVIGSYWLLLPSVILGGVMFLGLGFTISGLAKTVEAVPAIANLVVFPMLFLGGTFFPLDIMPTWLQSIVQYLPLTYLSDALRSVMTESASFTAISHDLFWMLGWSAVLVFLANLTFGFEEKRV
ncbi:MAG: ABC-2 transporter permease [Candidatus Kerfeldbacteria bacterium]|nr:ABC-2 transporter permease [Candidatus Kerfeldbacteria bacterium]